MIKRIQIIHFGNTIFEPSQENNDEIICFRNENMAIGIFLKHELLITAKIRLLTTKAIIVLRIGCESS